MTKADKSRPSTQVYQYVSLQVSQECMFASIKVTMYPKKASTQVSQVCKYASIPCMYIRMYVSTQVCKYASMQVCKYLSIKSIQVSKVGKFQECYHVLVSLKSWPGQIFFLNPCLRPKILARMLFLGDFVLKSSNS